MAYFRCRNESRDTAHARFRAEDATTLARRIPHITNVTVSIGAVVEYGTIERAEEGRVLGSALGIVGHVEIVLYVLSPDALEDLLERVHS